MRLTLFLLLQAAKDDANTSKLRRLRIFSFSRSDVESICSTNAADVDVYYCRLGLYMDDIMMLGACNGELGRGRFLFGMAGHVCVMYVGTYDTASSKHGRTNELIGNL